MIAAVATLAFLTALWLVAVASATTIRDSGGKAVAALIGRSPLAMATRVSFAPVRVSQRPAGGLQAVLRAGPEWRAAA